jgi:UDP-N-acetylmuramate dehydrogenase
VFIAEIVQSVELLGADGSRREASREEMGFGYDASLLHQGKDLALAASFQLSRGDIATMHRVMQENLSWRGAKHPWLEWHPSAGSIFKKIEGVGAGRLIEQSGLKGFRTGDAQVSHIHANILVNLGHATARDVRSLIALIQDTVRQKFDLQLECEILFVGDF